MQLQRIVDQTFVESPIGRLKLCADAFGIRSLAFDDETFGSNPTSESGNRHLQILKKELTLYFSGELQTFTCKIKPQGTEFQMRNWKQLSSIPFGIAKSYGQIAEEIGQPKASRAVGGAINRNPIPIVIPCHRVIGANHTLVGFAGGLWRKQWMLEHEGFSLPLNSESRG